MRRRRLMKYYDAEVRTCNDQLRHNARAGTLVSPPLLSSSGTTTPHGRDTTSTGLRDPVAEYLREPEDDVD